MPSHFLSSNHPLYVLGCASKHKSQGRGRKDPASAKPPSLTIPQTEENSNALAYSRIHLSNKPSKISSSNDPMLGRANAIGIVGGSFVDTTLNFVRKIVDLGSNDEGNELPFIVCSDPVLSKELLSIRRRRSSFASLVGKREGMPIDEGKVIENLRRKSLFLEKSGVCCIVMPCHISHSWHNEVLEGCSVPFIHMGECVAKELKEAKLKPLEAGSPLRIGVLATDATLAARIYNEKLQNEGFEVIHPDKATMEHIMIPAVEALSRKDIEGAQNLFRIALQFLLVRAVNTVILASDDMRELLPPDDPLWRKCMDPMDALARSTVKHAQSANSIVSEETERV